MGVQMEPSPHKGRIRAAKAGLTATQPISTGVQPATIPRKVHEIVLRHTDEAMTPISPNRKQRGCSTQAKANPKTISPMIRGRVFCGGAIRLDGKARLDVLVIRASTL